MQAGTYRHDVAAWINYLHSTRCGANPSTPPKRCGPISSLSGQSETLLFDPWRASSTTSTTTGERELQFSRSKAAEYCYCADRPEGNLETVGRQTSSASNHARGRPRVCRSILKSRMHSDGNKIGGQRLHVVEPPWRAVLLCLKTLGRWLVNVPVPCTYVIVRYDVPKHW